jgi:hypothetical protein
MIEKMTEIPAEETVALEQEIVDYDDTVFKDMLKIVLECAEALEDMAQDRNLDEFELRRNLLLLGKAMVTNSVTSLSRVWNDEMTKILKGE